MAENKAFWKEKAQYLEEKLNALEARYRTLLDQNHIMWQKERELKAEFEAKRKFMEAVETAYREYQIAFATGDTVADECEGDWHGQIGGDD